MPLMGYNESNVYFFQKTNRKDCCRSFYRGRIFVFSKQGRSSSGYRFRQRGARQCKRQFRDRQQTDQHCKQRHHVHAGHAQCERGAKHRTCRMGAPRHSSNRLNIPLQSILEIGGDGRHILCMGMAHIGKICSHCRCVSWRIQHCLPH